VCWFLQTPVPDSGFDSPVPSAESMKIPDKWLTSFELFIARVGDDFDPINYKWLTGKMPFPSFSLPTDGS
jgi:hypothetical protein